MLSVSRITLVVEPCSVVRGRVSEEAVESVSSVDMASAPKMVTLLLNVGNHRQNHTLSNQNTVTFQFPSSEDLICHQFLA